MAYEDEQSTGFGADLCKELPRLARDLGESLPTRFDHQCRIRDHFGRDEGDRRQLAIHDNPPRAA